MGGESFSYADDGADDGLDDGMDNDFRGSMISQSAAPNRYIAAATKNAAWKDPNIRWSSAADRGASMADRLEARLTKPAAVPKFEVDPWWPKPRQVVRSACQRQEDDRRSR